MNYFKLIQDYLKEIKKNTFRLIYSVFVLLIIVVVLSYLPSPKTIDIENSRYLESALIQSLAAIFAIVVTVTLIAIQLASHNYSPRVAKLFIYDNWFWGLFLIFLFSITFISFFLLNLDKNERMFYVVGTILMFVACFYYLGEYTAKLSEFLSLESLISNEKNI